MVKRTANLLRQPQSGFHTINVSAQTGYQRQSRIRE
ncbi:hypothetical protein HDIA_2307 [Hartmannibacter diazotrophicus]|uniref:Uncharacterized protein n=1 Tax=Hartmannibacter diazotrophicus TaxID=1482074 RepID=A0A2C9D6S4_9HYPH|nr:hypothetical protein HDIA_2307 [Hartmannibacter diazotrophicus]